VKPARFIFSLLGVALFLAIATVLILSAVAQASGTPMLDWGTRAGSVLGLVLLAVLVIRAALLWADNRKQKR
jgi:uncharacterized membrane protein